MYDALYFCLFVPLSPVFPICPGPPIMPGMPRGPGKPCGPCGPGDPGGPGGPGGPITPAPPSTALLALTATAASLSVTEETASSFWLNYLWWRATDCSGDESRKMSQSNLPHGHQRWIFRLTLQHLQYHFNNMLVRCITSLERRGNWASRGDSNRYVPCIINEIRSELDSLVFPECLTCRELLALHWVPYDQAVLVVPGLQVYQGLQWVHCVRSHP